MPKVRHGKPPPEGWDIVEPTFMELERKMRDVESESHEGKRKAESVWPIFRIHHQRSRYLFDMFYKKQAISRELYDWCLKEGYGDQNLIAKWKKLGYERLCCLRCIQTKDHTYGTTCICRVSRDRLEPGKVVECIHCGCRGCNTADVEATLTLPKMGPEAEDEAEQQGEEAHDGHQGHSHWQGGHGHGAGASGPAAAVAQQPMAPYPYPYPYPFPPAGYPFPPGFAPPHMAGAAGPAGAAAAGAAGAPGGPPPGYPPYPFPYPPMPYGYSPMPPMPPMPGAAGAGAGAASGPAVAAAGAERAMPPGMPYPPWPYPGQAPPGAAAPVAKADAGTASGAAGAAGSGEAPGADAATAIPASEPEKQ